MNVLGAAVRKTTHTVGRAADAATTAAGAVGGAAISGAIGGVVGTLDGMRQGLGSGSRSTPAAALTLGAVGISGLVEWPLLLAVGGGTLVLRQLNRPAQGSATPVAVPGKQASAAQKPPANPRRSAPGKATARR